MRVAFNGLFLDARVGTGQYSRELLRALREVGGAEILPLSTREVRPPASFAPSENAVKLWFEQRGLPAAALERGADLLHYPYFAAPLRPLAPLVVTIHDLIPLVLPEYRGNALVRAYMQLQGVAVRRAGVILADSNASRHDIVRLLDIPRQRVRVVPLGVDPSFRPLPPEAADAARKRYRLPERYVLHTAGLDVRKNVERLVLAYARARASLGVTEPLALTGNPDRRDALTPPLRQLVEQLGIEQYVRFLGIVPQEDLPGLYNGCALAVTASRYEGFGLPVLEAMACGAVVACSDASSLPEVAGDAAITFAPDDEEACATALARGLQEEALRAELREKGLARAAEFTWEKTARATLQAYHDVLASS